MSISGALNFLPKREADEKSLKNQQKILQFLSQEKFSTVNVLQALLGLKTRAGAWKILSKMERDNLVKQHRYSSTLTLWGITIEGMHEFILDKQTIEDWSYFTPSKVSLLTLAHSLDVQRIHAICDQLGLTFKVGRTLGSRSESDKVPDAIIPVGDEMIAVEVERTIKSRQRYDAIVYNYLKAIKAKQYHKVLYIMPDKKRCLQVKKAFYNLGQITMTINGRKQTLMLESDKHLSFFYFIAIEEASSYLQNHCIKTHT
jgi:hypothetical protein